MPLSTSQIEIPAVRGYHPARKEQSTMLRSLCETRRMGLVLLLPSLAAAQKLTVQDILKLPVPPADHRIFYGRNQRQFGDLRLPKGPGKHPVAVVIHGGCWLAEYNLDHISNLCAALTRAGIATWSLEYRRIGDVGGAWRGTFEDVSRGTDHLQAIAGCYHLDLNRNPQISTQSNNLVGPDSGAGVGGSNPLAPIFGFKRIQPVSEDRSFG